MPGNHGLGTALDAACGIKIVSEYRNTQEALRAQHRHAIAIMPEGGERLARFNCFAYALGIWDRNEYVSLVDDAQDSTVLNSAIVRQMFNEDLLTARDPLAVQRGDVILYYHGEALVHAGRVADIEPLLTIHSKWGGNEIHQHGVWEVPAMYGDRVGLFVKPDSNIIMDRLLATRRETDV
jgi:hypothetical protein